MILVDVEGGEEEALQLAEEALRAKEMQSLDEKATDVYGLLYLVSVKKGDRASSEVFREKLLKLGATNSMLREKIAKFKLIT